MRTILPKGPTDRCAMEELLKEVPLDTSKLCGLRSKIVTFDEDCFDPSWFKSLNDKATDDK